MTIIKRNENNFPTIPSFFDNLFNRDWLDWTSSNFSNTNTTLPAVNIRESENDYDIEVAAPGMKKDDFQINIDKNILTISSEKEDEKKEEKDNYSRREFSYQSFQRSFNIPDNVVDGEKISAKYSDGILHIKLPKREEVKPKPARTIKIS